jgi:hypothetical protein
MDDLTYWTEKLRQAKQELDAARTRTALDEAARRFQRAKAELRALEQSAKTPRASVQRKCGPHAGGRTRTSTIGDRASLAHDQG